VGSDVRGMGAAARAALLEAISTCSGLTAANIDIDIYQGNEATRCTCQIGTCNATCRCYCKDVCAVVRNCMTCVLVLYKTTRGPYIASAASS
jgi:hypothetical protein